MIYVGTSGYRFADWAGSFYPEGMKEGEQLAYYSQHFPTVELNFTFYRVPTAKTIAAMVDRTPPSFLFTAKISQAITHDLDRTVLEPFKAGIEPARAAGRLGGLLAQFPYSFKNTLDNRNFLHQLAEDFADYHPVVEFRHLSWIKPAVFDFLRGNRLGFCCVDEPKLSNLVPPVAEATSDTAYVRFHSRDASKWYESGAERYNYLYTKEEMSEWLPKVQKLRDEAENVYIFFNNCHAGHAAVNAAEFQQLLRDIGLLQALA
jgi:uncharacterized protein YecE (DUF72 family)